MPEMNGADYDVYTSEQNDGNDMSHVDLWFIPRVAGKPVVRQYFEKKYGWPTPNLENLPTAVRCSLRLEYEAATESACGEFKQCWQLDLTMTHVQSADGFCGLPPRERHVLEEDFLTHRLAYQADLRPGNTDDDSSLIGEAIRRRLAAQWQSVTPSGAPPPLVEANAYTVGEKILVFGISKEGVFAGGWFSTQDDQWTPLPTEGAPRFEQFGVWGWTGSKLLVVTAGAAAWLDGDAWKAAPTEGLPAFSTGGVPGCIRMANTDDEFFIWGSRRLNDQYTSLGATLSPDANVWRPISAADAPDSECYLAITATDREFIVSGDDGSHHMYYLQGQGRWVQADDLPVVDAFAWHGSHVVVSEMEGFNTHILNTMDGTWGDFSELARVQSGIANVGGGVAYFGGLDQTREATKDGRLVALGRDGWIDIQGSDILGPRMKPLVAFVSPASLFVWGGCSALDNGRCLDYTNTGAVLNANLGQ
jgi:hypothetical protein